MRPGVRSATTCSFAEQAPDGMLYTESQGGDHAWLRGVFIAWPQVGGNRPAGFWTCGQAVWKEKGAIVNR
jgi:hypothetical protein